MKVRSFLNNLFKRNKSSGSFIKGFVEIYKNGKKVYSTNNTITYSGENFIANLLARSAVLNQPYEDLPENYIDYIAIGAGYKLTDTSSDASKVILPYSPIDGNEPNDLYLGRKIKCISGSNAGEVRIVTEYDAANKTITVDSAFSHAPAAGDVYVIETDRREIQLQGEKQEDGNGNVISKSRLAVSNKMIGNKPNEVIFESTWDSSTGAYIIAEAGYFYNLSSDVDGNSANHSPSEQEMFARVAFIDNPIYKGAEDEVTIRWTFRIGDPR